jgi:gamma-glutamyl:cysteine ligase YbdK (ATP-grasp superfamily)
MWSAMGEEIADGSARPEDRERFAERCREGLVALQGLLARPGFGEGPDSMGVELEVGLIDARAQPAPVNHQVIETAAEPGLALELDRFNLEYNCPPQRLTGAPFSAIGDDLSAALGRIEAAAAVHGARPVAVGILPTLRAEHLGAGAMSDSPRYRALNAGLRGLRGGPFEIRIQGIESLDTTWDDVTLEGAATGLHVHLRVPPERFAATMNAAQMATGPVLAAAVNSPLLMGRVLWQETRIAVFGQAVDDRAPVTAAWLPSRASFGHGWVADALDPFSESVALHVPILPVLGDEDPLAVLRAGGVPSLDELRLHHGTVWRWNRTVLALGDDPHLRLEMRALPGGPSPRDMAANVAFMVGLTLSVAAEMGWMARSMPFDMARRNFYTAARQGLEAELLWPSPTAPSPRPAHAPDLVRRLIPRAADALAMAGVDRREAEALLEIVHARADRGATGASWQRRALAALERHLSRDEALARMTEEYLARCREGAPVAEWNLPGS